MSTKTTAEKLLIKPGTSVWLSHPPHLNLIQPVPENVDVVDEMAGASIALMFVESADTLRGMLVERQHDLKKPSVFWIAYPKGNKADINRDTLWPMLADYQMRPIGQVAVDDVWSALRFRPLKEGEAQFSGGKKTRE